MLQQQLTPPDEDPWTGDPSVSEEDKLEAIRIQNRLRSAETMYRNKPDPFWAKWGPTFYD